MQWIVVVLVAALVGSAFAQTSVTAVGRGQTLTLTVGKIHYTYTLSDMRIGVDMDEAKLLDIQHKNGLAYVLLDINGPSRRNGGARQCGAGYERSLVWLRLERWRLLEVRAVRYDSCWYTLESDVPLKQSGSLFTIAFMDFGAMKDKIATYDRARPELGFALTGRPMTLPK